MNLFGLSNQFEILLVSYFRDFHEQLQHLQTVNGRNSPPKPQTSWS